MKVRKKNNLDYQNRYKLEFSYSCNVQVLLLKKFVQYGVANQILLLQICIYNRYSDLYCITLNRSLLNRVYNRV